MSPESVKTTRYSVKRATSARRKRLEIRRLKTVCPMETDILSDNGNCLRSTLLDQKKPKPSLESNTIAGTDLKTLDGSVKLSVSPPSSENDALPVGILVAGGKICGREEELRSCTCQSHGSVSLKGRRREMEDTVTVVPGFLSGESASYDFFAVYDGHGGSKVAQACRDRLHWLVVKEIEEREGKLDWEKVMVDSFCKMDDEINGRVSQVENGSASMKTIGSTAVVALVGAEQLVVANCGDSRAVLSRGGVAVPLSRDHKPDRPDEMERVEAAGGRIINWNGYRVLGVLATSRSIGDQYLKPFVIPEPEVTVSDRINADEFLILASDGLWDVISNKFACDVVRKCLHGRLRKTSSETQIGNTAADAVAVLAELAMARGSKDNISIIVVELKKNPQVNC